MNINQSNVNGNNIIEIKLTIDIGRLKTIVETERDRIKNIFSKINKKGDLKNNDDSSTSIHNKNLSNELTSYYEEFIKKHEGKLEILKKFFQDEDYSYEIDEASEHLKELIFSFKNQNTYKLTPEIMSILINQHTASLSDYEDKNIMKLIIYYLYRYCFIGLK